MIFIAYDFLWCDNAVSVSTHTECENREFQQFSLSHSERRNFKLSKGCDRNERGDIQFSQIFTQQQDTLSCVDEATAKSSRREKSTCPTRMRIAKCPKLTIIITLCTLSCRPTHNICIPQKWNVFSGDCLSVSDVGVCIDLIEQYLLSHDTFHICTLPCFAFPPPFHLSHKTHHLIKYLHELCLISKLEIITSTTNESKTFRQQHEKV